jgi:hypothetical protein
VSPAGDRRCGPPASSISSEGEAARQVRSGAGQSHPGTEDDQSRDPMGRSRGWSVRARSAGREQERGAWRHGLLWRAGAVAAAGLGSWLLIGLAAGARLGWRMALVAAWAAGGADLVRRQRGGNRTSASARYGDGKLLCNAAPRGRSGRWRWTATWCCTTSVRRCGARCHRPPAWGTLLTSTSSKPSSRVLTRTPSSAAWSGRRPRSTVRTGSVTTSNPSSDATSLASLGRPLTRTAYRMLPMAAPIPLGTSSAIKT